MAGVALAIGGTLCAACGYTLQKIAHTRCQNDQVARMAALAAADGADFFAGTSLAVNPRQQLGPEHEEQRPRAAPHSNHSGNQDHAVLVVPPPTPASSRSDVVVAAATAAERGSSDERKVPLLLLRAGSSELVQVVRSTRSVVRATPSFEHADSGSSSCLGSGSGAPFDIGARAHEETKKSMASTAATMLGAGAAPASSPSVQVTLLSSRSQRRVAQQEGAPTSASVGHTATPTPRAVCEAGVSPTVAGAIATPSTSRTAGGGFLDAPMLPTIMETRHGNFASSLSSINAERAVGLSSITPTALDAGGGRSEVANTTAGVAASHGFVHVPGVEGDASEHSPETGAAPGVDAASSPRSVSNVRRGQPIALAESDASTEREAAPKLHLLTSVSPSSASQQGCAVHGGGVDPTVGAMHDHAGGAHTFVVHPSIKSQFSPNADRKWGAQPPDEQQTQQLWEPTETEAGEATQPPFVNGGKQLPPLRRVVSEPILPMDNVLGQHQHGSDADATGGLLGVKAADGQTAPAGGGGVPSGALVPPRRAVTSVGSVAEAPAFVDFAGLTERRKKANMYKAKPFWMYWQFGAGLGMLVIGAIINVVSYGLAGQAELAPTSAITLIWNTLLAWRILREPFTRIDAISLGLMGAGTTVALVFGRSSDNEYDLDGVLRLLDRPVVWAYASVSGLLVFAAMLTARWYGRRAPSKLSLRQAILDAISRAFTAGMLGGYTGFLVKASVELALDGVTNGDWSAFKRFEPYIFLVILALVLFNQVAFMNSGLARYESSRVIPIYQCTLVFSGVMSGFIFFDELAVQTRLSLILFAVGCCITIAGILVLMLKPRTGIVVEVTTIEVQEVVTLDVPATMTTEQPGVEGSSVVGHDLPPSTTAASVPAGEAGSSALSVHAAPVGEAAFVYPPSAASPAVGLPASHARASVAHLAPPPPLSLHTRGGSALMTSAPMYTTRTTKRMFTIDADEHDNVFSLTELRLPSAGGEVHAAESRTATLPSLAGANGAPPRHSTRASWTAAALPSIESVHAPSSFQHGRGRRHVSATHVMVSVPPLPVEPSHHESSAVSVVGITSTSNATAADTAHVSNNRSVLVSVEPVAAVGDRFGLSSTLAYNVPAYAAGHARATTLTNRVASGSGSSAVAPLPINGGITAAPRAARAPSQPSPLRSVAVYTEEASAAALAPPQRAISSRSIWVEQPSSVSSHRPPLAGGGQSVARRICVSTSFSPGGALAASPQLASGTHGGATVAGNSSSVGGGWYTPMSHASTITTTARTHITRISRFGLPSGVRRVDARALRSAAAGNGGGASIVGGDDGGAASKASKPPPSVVGLPPPIPSAGAAGSAGGSHLLHNHVASSFALPNADFSARSGALSLRSPDTVHTFTSVRSAEACSSIVDEPGREVADLRREANIEMSSVGGFLPGISVLRDIFQAAHEWWQERRRRNDGDDGRLSPRPRGAAGVWFAADEQPAGSGAHAPVQQYGWQEAATDVPPQSNAESIPRVQDFGTRSGARHVAQQEVCNMAHQVVPSCAPTSAQQAAVPSSGSPCDDPSSAPQTERASCARSGDVDAAAPDVQVGQEDASSRVCAFLSTSPVALHVDPNSASHFVPIPSCSTSGSVATSCNQRVSNSDLDHEGDDDKARR